MRQDYRHLDDTEIRGRVSLCPYCFALVFRLNTWEHTEWHVKKGDIPPIAPKYACGRDLVIAAEQDDADSYISHQGIADARVLINTQEDAHKLRGITLGERDDWRIHWLFKYSLLVPELRRDLAARVVNGTLYSYTAEDSPFNPNDDPLVAWLS